MKRLIGFLLIFLVFSVSLRAQESDENELQVSGGGYTVPRGRKINGNLMNLRDDGAIVQLAFLHRVSSGFYIGGIGTAQWVRVHATILNSGDTSKLTERTLGMGLVCRQKVGSALTKVYPFAQFTAEGCYSERNNDLVRSTGMGFAVGVRSGLSIQVSSRFKMQLFYGHFYFSLIQWYESGAGKMVKDQREFNLQNSLGLRSVLLGLTIGL